MVFKDKSWEAMFSVRPAWHVVENDVIGLSGGLGVIWDPKIIEMQAFMSCARISMTMHMMGNYQRV